MMNTPVHVTRSSGAVLLVMVALAWLVMSANVVHASSNDTLAQVDFKQNLGDIVPGDVVFRNEQGQPATLKQISNGKPVFLIMGYFHCKMLCDMVIQDLAQTIEHVPYTPGKDYQVVFISIDPKETSQNALAKRNAMIKPQQQAGWHLLTGDKHAIDRVADAIGFKYAYDKKTDQFAHPAGAVMLTADLQISRYLYGMRFASRDVKFALIDSAKGKVGTFTDQLLLRCYCYDPITGQYGLAIVATLDIAGVVTVFALITMISLLAYKHRRQKLVAADVPPSQQANVAREAS